MNSTQPIADLDWLHDLIQRRTGLRVSETQNQNVAGIVANARAALATQKNDELRAILSHEPIDHPLWRALIHAVSVGETYFFRNRHQFNALRTEILPALIDKRRRAGSKHLRLWSAGCATGEEPYSLAILLRELLPDFEAWHITLLATDINQVSLERARRGVYRAWSFRDETPAHIQAQWFTPTAQGYELQATIRNSVIFQPLNLVSDEYPSYESGTMSMDIIMCRNVMIYFDQETTHRIASRFCRALNAEGWLIVGHVEPLASVYEGFSTRNFPNTLVYQKLVAEGAAAVRPPAMPENKPVPLPLLLLDTPKAEIQPLAESPIGRRPEPSGVIQDDKAAVEAGSSWQYAKRAADLEQWQEALLWLAQAADEEPLQPQVYYLRALVQQHIGDADGAVTSLRQAIYCDPSFALAHYSLGDLYETSGVSALAARHWRLAQAALTPMNLDDYLPFADDMTVNMLQGLLAYRLNNVSNKGQA